MPRAQLNPYLQPLLALWQLQLNCEAHTSIPAWLQRPQAAASMNEGMSYAWCVETQHPRRFRRASCVTMRKPHAPLRTLPAASKHQHDNIYEPPALSPPTLVASSTLLLNLVLS
jgi:hypothetical protein